MSAVDTPTREARTETFCATCGLSFAPDMTHCPHDGTKLVRLHDDGDTLIGKVLDGRYKILAPLGEGGMGTVYRATQISIDREVALKVVHPAIAKRRDAAKRFLREVRLASRLSAPNIVNVYDFGQSEEGVLFLVMELVKGETLHRVLKRDSPLSTARVVDIAVQLCDALTVAHEAGIVHRDLKPNNVIVIADASGREHVKVLDFGLAKTVGVDSETGITNAEAVIGTPTYMAPEQIEGHPLDARTDLYALGCMLHQLLVGKVPYVDPSITALFAKHLQAPIPQLPGPLGPIVARLLAKHPDDRFASARELRAALVAIDQPAVAPPVAPPPPRRSSRWLVISGVAVVLIGAGAGVLVGMKKDPAVVVPDAPRAIDAAVVVPAIVVDAAEAVDAAPPPDAPVVRPPVKKPPRPPVKKPPKPNDDLPFLNP